ncbi:helix-turn-helix domain-containing protein [Seonamhaeicola marinus]|uniref:AraC family transcriptional regulator n=1 Tax=Seonamhaeicola marinus TaxID=1912246 RepID=A0A5D0HYU2_9FLAO|nr:helix-turn-helix domain-containing protein [Seonamhaeicola marinus]TYA74662.1 AraC family transcriptional regulator [Seonamhaeicola marinus]
MIDSYLNIFSHFQVFGLLNISLLFILIFAYSDTKLRLWYGAFVLSIALEIFNTKGLFYLYNYSPNFTLVYLPWIAFAPIAFYKHTIISLNLNASSYRKTFRLATSIFVIMLAYFVIKSYYVLLGDLSIRERFFSTQYNYPKIEYWINNSIIIAFDCFGLLTAFHVFKVKSLKFSKDGYVLFFMLLSITIVHVASFLADSIHGADSILSAPNHFYLTILTIGGMIIAYRKIMGLNQKLEKEKIHTTNRIDKEQLIILEQKLITSMEDDKLFKNQKLQLKDLSRAMNTSENSISEVFAKQLNTNYYDFINGYRVQEVIRLMKLERFNDYKLIAIAEEAGFNSKTTFNTVFKKTTGYTPSQYRKELALSV